MHSPKFRIRNRNVEYLSSGGGEGYMYRLRKYKNVKLRKLSKLINVCVGPVRGLMVINVGFRGRSSIPSVCQITDADLGQVG